MADVAAALAFENQKDRPLFPETGTLIRREPHCDRNDRASQAPRDDRDERP